MDIVTQALKIMESNFNEGTLGFSNSKAAMDYCRLHLGAEKEEVFGVIFLDIRNRLLGFEKMFRGTVAELNVHARPIIRRIIELNAAKVIFTHNHPSGFTKPSDADIILTERLKKLFKEIDCHVLDHIIVTAKEAVSMVEAGVM